MESSRENKIHHLNLIKIKIVIKKVYSFETLKQRVRLSESITELYLCKYSLVQRL